MALVFEWDFRKAKANHRKHRVSFDEACTVFDDPLAKIFPDEDHSNREEREIIVGHSLLERLLVVRFYRAGHWPNSNRQCACGDTERAEGL